MKATSSKYEKLAKAAIEALGSYYGGNPKSKYIYGAAVLTRGGKIYTASNYGSDTATLTLHAEQSALAHAAAHRDTKIEAIATAMKEDPKGREFCHPCGICKQLIWESALKSGTNIKVVMANLHGEFIVKSIEELVPYPWPANRASWRKGVGSD